MAMAQAAQAHDVRSYYFFDLYANPGCEPHANVPQVKRDILTAVIELLALKPN